MSAEYLQPKSFEELESSLLRLTDKSVILAGGTDLLPKIRSGKKEPDNYLSLCRLEMLGNIERQGDWLKIGAMATHEQAADNPLIREYFTGLAMACSRVGSQQIRNKGTLGGSLANASPAGDIMPCVFLYGGKIEILGKEGIRFVEAKEFLTENGRTVLGRNELLTSIWLPVEEGRKSCFTKLGSRREVTIAQISLCISWKEQDLACRDMRGFIGAVDVRPVEFECVSLLGERSEEKKEEAAQWLSGKIRSIRTSRTRESKLKITEAEKRYKERAVKGIVFDAAEMIERERKSPVPETAKRGSTFHTEEKGEGK